MYLLVELSKSLADFAGLFAVLSHELDVGVPAVALACPARAARLAVLARGTAVVPTAQFAGLVALRLDPGVPAAVAGPSFAVDIDILAITCIHHIFITLVSCSNFECHHTKVHNCYAFT